MHCCIRITTLKSIKWNVSRTMLRFFLEYICFCPLIGIDQRIYWRNNVVTLITHVTITLHASHEIRNPTSSYNFRKPFLFCSPLWFVPHSIRCVRLLQLLCFVTHCFCVILIELWFKKKHPVLSTFIYLILRGIKDLIILLLCPDI